MAERSPPKRGFPATKRSNDHLVRYDADLKTGRGRLTAPHNAQLKGDRISRAAGGVESGLAGAASTPAKNVSRA